MNRLRIESKTPEGWIPEGAAVAALARRYPDGHWEAVAPAFSIAGVGSSPEDALQNALELLDEYLCMIAAEGRTFEDAIRPSKSRDMLAMLREVIGLIARSKLGRPDHHDRDNQRYRIPLRPLGAH